MKEMEDGFKPCLKCGGNGTVKKKSIVNRNALITVKCRACRGTGHEFYPKPVDRNPALDAQC